MWKSISTTFTILFRIWILWMSLSVWINVTPYTPCLTWLVITWHIMWHVGRRITVSLCVYWSRRFHSFIMWLNHYFVMWLRLNLLVPTSDQLSFAMNCPLENCCPNFRPHFQIDFRGAISMSDLNQEEISPCSSAIKNDPCKKHYYFHLQVYRTCYTWAWKSYSV